MDTFTWEPVRDPDLYTPQVGEYLIRLECPTKGLTTWYTKKQGKTDYFYLDFSSFVSEYQIIIGDSSTLTYYRYISPLKMRVLKELKLTA